MKRYEKYTKEEIIEYFAEASGSECEECNWNHYCTDGNAIQCSDAVCKWLNEEVKMIPRCHKCKTVEDFEKEYDEFRRMCQKTICSKCSYAKDGNSSWCIALYMMEEVEE